MWDVLIKGEVMSKNQFVRFNRLHPWGVIEASLGRPLSVLEVSFGLPLGFLGALLGWPWGVLGVPWGILVCIILELHWGLLGV